MAGRSSFIVGHPHPEMFAESWKGMMIYRKEAAASLREKFVQHYELIALGFVEGAGGTTPTVWAQEHGATKEELPWPKYEAGRQGRGHWIYGRNLERKHINPLTVCRSSFAANERQHHSIIAAAGGGVPPVYIVFV